MPENNKHVRYFDLLCKIAEASEPVANYRLAACIVYKNDIVSFGRSQYKSHLFQKQFGKNSDSIFLHAETDAIRLATKHLNSVEFAKSILYVCRVKKERPKSNGFVWGMSKPCDGCSRCIASFGIRNVYYTCNEGEFSCL